MNLAPLPIQKFFSNDGRPLNGGLLFTYVAGTSTKIATYTDSTGGTPNTNPIVLNFRGEANVWLDPTLTYKFVLSPANDTDPPTNPIWSVDNISSGITFASLTQQILGQIIYPRTIGEIYAAVTPQHYIYTPGQVGGLTHNVFRYMTDAEIQSAIAEDGIVDHTAAIQAANDFLEGRSSGGAGGAPHPGGTLFFPAGVYNITGANTLRVGGNVTWRGDQYHAAVLNFPSKTNSGTAITLGPDQSGFFPWTNSYTVGSTIESMYISLDSDNTFAFIIGTPGAHQFSHLKNLLIQGVNHIALQMGSTGGPAFFYVKDVDIVGGTLVSVDRTGLFISSGSIVEVDTVSIDGATGKNFSIGVRVHEGAVKAGNLHFENVDDGFYFDNQSTPNCSTIRGLSGNSTTTNLIHIPSPCNHALTAEGILGLTGDAAHPVAIKNDVTGEALLNTMVGVYSWSGDTTAFRSGSFGYSAFHNTPHIRYGKNAVQAVAQNTVVVLTFPIKDNDWLNSGSEWSGSVYTPKIPGVYRVTVSVQLDSTTWAAGNRFILAIRKSGATHGSMESRSFVGTFLTQLQCTDTIYCAAGDTIDTFVFQNAVATVNTDSSVTTCYIAIDRE